MWSVAPMGLEALLDGMHPHGSARDHRIVAVGNVGWRPFGTDAEYFLGSTDHSMTA